MVKKEADNEKGGVAFTMPRKGRDFELAYKELSELDIERYRVSSPAWIYDRTTGVKREVDVLIEYNDTDGHLRRIAVECRDHKDKQNAMWIEQLITKRNDLELDFLIAVTTSDFTEGAILKARHHGVIIEKAELFNKTLVEEISGEFYVDLFFLRFSLIECKCLIGGSVISIKELLQKLSLIRQQELLHFINTDLYFSIEPNEVMDKEDFDMEMFYDHPDNSFIEFEADSFYCDNEHRPPIIKELNIQGFFLKTRMTPFKTTLLLNRSLSVFEVDSHKNKKYFGFFGDEEEYFKLGYLNNKEIQNSLHLKKRKYYRFVRASMTINTVFPNGAAICQDDLDSIIKNGLGEFDMSQLR